MNAWGDWKPVTLDSVIRNAEEEEIEFLIEMSRAEITPSTSDSATLQAAPMIVNRIASEVRREL